MRRHALLLLVLLCLSLCHSALAQVKPLEPVTTLEALASVAIELVGSDNAVKVESATFRAINTAMWMTKGASADAKAPKGLTQIRLGAMDIKKLAVDLILVKLEEKKKSYRYYVIEGVRGKGEVKPAILFDPFAPALLSFDAPIPTPRPVRIADGTYVINLPKPLAPGHYAVIPGLFHTTSGTALTTQNPSIAGWDFEVTE